MNQDNTQIEQENKNLLISIDDYDLIKKNEMTQQLNNNNHNNNLLTKPTNQILKPIEQVQVHEQDYPQTDQSIDLERNEEGYKLLDNSLMSDTQQQQQQKKQQPQQQEEQNLYNPRKQMKLNQDEQQPCSVLSKLKNGIVNFMTKLKEMKCPKNNEYSQQSDKQLFVGIFLKSAAAYYFMKQSKILKERRKEAILNENILRKIDNTLSDKPFYYFDNATAEQRICIKGSIHNHHNNNPIRLNEFMEVQSPTVNKSIQQQQQNNHEPFYKRMRRRIILKTEQYEEQGVPIPLQSEKNILTSAVCAMTYFISSNIFQFKIKFSEGLKLSNFSDSFYFFGRKSVFDGGVLKVESVMKSIDYLKIKSDSTALKISIAVCSCLAVYLAKHACYNALLLAKRKKITFKKIFNNILELFKL